MRKNLAILLPALFSCRPPVANPQSTDIRSKTHSGITSAIQLSGGDTLEALYKRYQA